jgi:hypothetical protein
MLSFKINLRLVVGLPIADSARIVLIDGHAQRRMARPRVKQVAPHMSRLFGAPAGLPIGQPFPSLICSAPAVLPRPSEACINRIGISNLNICAHAQVHHVITLIQLSHTRMAGKSIEQRHAQRLDLVHASPTEFCKFHS